MSDVYDWSALAQILKNSGISSGDISRVFSPELGELTGTFYQNPEVSAQEEELSWLQNAPNMRRALNLPDDDIRKIIAAAIYRGENPWDVRRQVEAYTAQQAELNPGVYNQEGETKDLLSFVDTVDSEWRKKTIANMKDGAEGSVLAKAGLPPKELEYSAEQLLPDLFDKLNSQAAGLRAEAAKFSVGDKTKKAALKYLEQQKTQAAAAKKERVPHPSLVPTEGFRAALSRNLANTPMGRGEAGVRGLIPLLKTLEQIPAGLMALQKSVVDPLYQEAAKNAKYIAQETIGTVPNVSVGKDVVGQILYGKPRSEIGKKADDGSYDRAEGARFGRIAQDVVTRAEDPKRKAAATEAKGKEQWMKDFTQILSTLVQERARQTGYTPYNEAVAARVNFLAAGGK
jgi:hypothetical protein